MRRRLWILLCVVLAACTTAPTTETTGVPEQTDSTTSTTAVTSTVEVSPVEPSGFRDVADGITKSLLTLQPQLVTDLGADGVIDVDVGHLLDDVTGRGARALADAATAGLAVLDGIDPDTLDRSEQLSADILRWHLDDLVTMAGYHDYQNPVNFITGSHTGFGEFMADVHPIATERNAEQYVDRLNAFRGQLGDLIDELGRRDRLGLVPTDRELSIARFQVGAAIGTGDPATHPLATDLKARVAALEGATRSWAAGVGAQAEAAVGGLLPLLEDLDGAIGRIDGRSDQTPGVTYVEGGDDYYAAVLRHHLGVDISPEVVHQSGLDLVELVVAELTGELNALGYDASESFALAIRRAAGDAGAMPTTTEPERAAVLERAATTVDQASRAFADLFYVEPAAGLEVVRPRPGREGGSGAYYRSPPIDGSRPGLYYLSLGGREFPTLTMDTTTYHEAIPGHHFQLSLQRSLVDLPLHQRVFDYTGYAEGWALYAERLAHEAGLYEDDPLGNIGRLRMELLRAVRMVVDTGIHWLGWSRNEAIDYMTGLGFENGQATAEVDRYIVWPGQAPAYMVGMVEILRLRNWAEAELGDDFDLAGFHDALLSQGSVPLALLERVVGSWVSDLR